MCQNDIVHLFPKCLMVDTVGLQYSNQWKNKKLINPINPTPTSLILVSDQAALSVETTFEEGVRVYFTQLNIKITNILKIGLENNQTKH